MKMTTGEIAEKVRGEVLGDAGILITGLSAADHAEAGDLTFAEKETHFAAGERGLASAILVAGPFTSNHKTLIRVANVRIAMARLMPSFFPGESFEPGVSPMASVAPSASVDPTAHVGPGCRIGAGARIGAKAVLMGGNFIGIDSVVGNETHLHPNVVIYSRTRLGQRVVIHAGTVIGSDGYGYVLDEGVHRKVEQSGHVVVHDDVEIGANAAIDRGTFGATTIGTGTKIDNLVHIAHNVTLGKHCLILGQVGFAGSTGVGDYAVIASQSGISGHLKLGNQCVVGAKSGVMRDVADGETVLGVPAAPDRQAKRQWIGIQQLPDALRRLRELETEVTRLRTALEKQA